MSGRGWWRRARVALAAGAVMLLAHGCASSLDPWTDANIESEVKARLVAQRDANLTRLGVVSRQATVYLTGTVESTEQKSRAEAVTREVTGVKGVVNALNVRAKRD